ncbi:MAG: TolC family protein [Acidobacteriota bacterium]
MRNIVAGLLLSAMYLGAQETQPSQVRYVTLDECIKAALEKNLAIRIESYTPKLGATFVKSAASVFDPVLTASVTDYDSKSKKVFIFDSSKLNQANFNFGLAQTLKTSTSYSIAFNNQRRNMDTTFSAYKPAFDVDLAIRVTQPVLKNFGPTIAKSKMMIAMKGREASEQQFRASVIDVITQVQQAYLNLAYAVANLKVQQESLKLAQDLLEQNKIRVQVGTLAPIDILQSEAEVATREEGILVAENSIQNYEDQLKRLMNLPGDAEDWSATIRPSDQPNFSPRPVTEKEMVKVALDKRPDLAQLKLDLESKGINLNYTKNQLRPDLSLFFQAGSAGVGGDLVLDSDAKPLPTPVPGGYGDAFSEAMRWDYPNWTFGLNFTLPIKNDAAEAAYEQATFEQLQAQLRIANLEQQIYQEVRGACRALDTNRKRIETTRAALRLAEKKLEAEQKKFSVGLSTNYFVLQFQKDLTQAQTNLLQAITDHQTSLIALDKFTGMTLERRNIEVSSSSK